MIPAEEHDINIDAAGPCGRRATLRCYTCQQAGVKPRFVAATVALAIKAHRQHVDEQLPPGDNPHRQEADQ